MFHKISQQRLLHLLWHLTCSVLFLFITACDRAAQPTTVAATALPTPHQSAFETAECQFSYSVEADIKCGYLVVPEDRDNPEQLIRLHVAVIPSTGSSPAPDPVVFLNGGPGSHTLALTDSLVTLFEPILADHDLILFDQRGTGYSEPALDCPEMMETLLLHLEADLDPVQEHANYLRALTACHDRLTAAGINLSAYNSASNAADLHELRQALGYESWNLLGVSYGTRLALTTMRDFGHTGTIRSIVLDSVFPPQADARASAGPNMDRAFNLLFARCAADEGCNKAYPDLKTRFYDLVDDLNQDPVSVMVTDRVTRTTYRMPFNGYDLIDTLFNMMYTPDQIITLPRLLVRLENKGTMPLSEWLSNHLRHFDAISLGMTYSVQCAEEIPFNSSTDFEATTATLPPQLAGYIQITTNSVLSICDLWQVKAADPVENEPVVSDIPILILSGDYDPITPPSFAQDTATYLNQAYYYEFAGQSHSVVGSSDCAMEMVVSFLSQPDIAPDDRCLERLYFGFVTP